MNVKLFTKFKKKNGYIILNILYIYIGVNYEFYSPWIQIHTPPKIIFQFMS